MERGEYDLINQSYAGPYGALPLSKFLIARGQRMKGAPLSSACHGGSARECFRNAWKFALDNDMEYWEGHAWDPAFGCVPIHHAWCRASLTWDIIEPTWRNGVNVLYFGIHVPASVLTQSLNETRTFGVLDNSAVFSSSSAARYFMRELTKTR